MDELTSRAQQVSATSLHDPSLPTPELNLDCLLIAVPSARGSFRINDTSNDHNDRLAHAVDFIDSICSLLSLCKKAKMVSAANVMIILTVILGGLAIGTVALREYCRVHQKHPFGADDVCILIALVCSTLSTKVAWILMSAQALSTAIDIVIDYALKVTGAGDPSTVPTQDGMIYCLKVASILAISLNGD